MRQTTHTEAEARGGSLLDMIRRDDQDFEWYPTTDEMLRVVADDINSRTYTVPNHLREELDGVMDIGAGDGRALRYIKEHCEGVHKFMAIEKSSILAKQWPDYVFPVGCDLMTQSLIDKPARVVFCNPPYSEYVQWMEKILTEGFFSDCYFIVPQRWAENQRVLDVIESREMKTETLWNGDFLDAERSARARVDIIRLHAHLNNWGGKDQVDPFSQWFDSQFSFHEAPEFEEGETTLRDRAVVKGENLIEALEELYRDELARLYNSYKAITDLDAQTLKDMGVERSAIRAALKSKIKGLKNKYWKEIFDNLDKVTSRLTNASRRALLEKLMSAVTVDFDASNVYTVLIWVIKNANQYFDSQLVDVFKALACKKSAVPYKSNRHFVDGTWRAMSSWEIHQGRCGRYALDYRFVLDGNYFKGDWSYGAIERRNNLLQDIATIANNLGFGGISINEMTSHDGNWIPGEWHKATFDGGVLFEAKGYMNGNLHFRFNQKFMARLNIEAGRLLGWLSTPKQAEEETGIKVNPEDWNSLFTLDMSEVRAIAA